MSDGSWEIEQLERVLITGVYDPGDSGPEIYLFPEFEIASPPGAGGGSGGGSSPPTSQPQCPSSARRDDKAVAFAHEGGIRTTGYTIKPGWRFPNSGVTIGAGVDLGAKTLADLQSFGMSQQGLNAVANYIGYKGQAAIDREALLGPPVINSIDATTISNGSYAQNVGQMITQFNASSGTPFDRLPEEAQTVLADMGYQRPNLATYPNFFSYVTQGQWANAVYELQHWRADGTSPQRMLELADRLQRAISAGSLSPNGHCQ